MAACKGRDAEPAPSGPAWVRGGLVDAMAMARLEGRLVLAEVGASWCPTCHQLERDVFDKAPGRLPPGLIAVRIDFDGPDGRSLASRYRVIGLPTTLVLDADGNERGRVEGYDGVESYVDGVRAAVAGSGPAVADLVASAESADPVALAATGAQLLARGEERAGMRALERARILDPEDAKGAWRDATRTVGRYHMRVLLDPSSALPFFMEGATRAADEDARWGFSYWVAMSLQAAGRDVTAVAWLDSLVARYPMAAEPRAVKAEFLFMRGGDDATALALARDAVRLAPGDDWNRYLVAVLAERTGDRKLAVAESSEAVRLAPGKAIYEDLVGRLK
jgi:thiol-disulfide isomerase/thioredoxin